MTNSAGAQQTPDWAAHLTDEDLERYHLGGIGDESELLRMEEHLIGCAACAQRAEEAAGYVDAMRAAIVDVELELQ